MDLNEKELLRTIELLGSSIVEESSKKIIINENSSSILDYSLGKARIRPSALKDFNLLLSTPNELEALNPFEIRCFNCGKVIEYPSYMRVVKYTKNIFYYFLCFNDGKPSLRCKK